MSCVFCFVITVYNLTISIDCWNKSELFTDFFTYCCIPVLLSQYSLTLREEKNSRFGTCSGILPSAAERCSCKSFLNSRLHGSIFFIYLLFLLFIFYTTFFSCRFPTLTPAKYHVHFRIVKKNNTKQLLTALKHAILV